MDFLKDFDQIMTKQSELALATSVDNFPNVRIVNFYYDTAKKGVVYFSTFGNNPKVGEFEKNSSVSFTTVPSDATEHVRVNRAQVRKSDNTIYDLKDRFVEKMPDYESIIEQAGSQIVLYEIHFNEATVTLDFMQSGRVHW